MNDTFTIDLGTAADINAIAQFQVDMAKESEDLELDINTLIKGVSAVIEDENKGMYLVAHLGTQAVGSLMVTREWSDWNSAWYWWIQSVYVAPEHRQKGIYRSMYDKVKTLAREQGVAQVRLYVDKTNIRGQKVYQSLGMNESHYLMYEEVM